MQPSTVQFKSYNVDQVLDKAPGMQTFEEKPVVVEEEQEEEMQNNNSQNNDSFGPNEPLTTTDLDKMLEEIKIAESELTSAMPIVKEA